MYSVFIVVISIFRVAHGGPVPTSGDAIDLSHFGSRIFGAPNANVGHSVHHWSNSKENSTITSNPEELGSYLEGDLLIPFKNGTDIPLGRNGMVAESYRWTDGIIPFEIVGNFNAFAMDLIEKAITAYHENTCIKFIPRRGTDRDYISVQSGNSGCWSSVGRTGGRQVVNLQTPGCTTKVGTIIHEFMHSAGFLHEQNREERDSFVSIMYSNIRKGYEANFHKASPGSTSGFGVTYDYGSVMHYSETAFSTNGQPTIVTKNKESIGQRDGFSAKDIQKIQNMYNCKATTASTGYKPEITLGSFITDMLTMIGPTIDNIGRKTYTNN